MRLFAILCYAIALYYGYTAVDAMRTGVTYPLSGETSTAHQRDQAGSKYSQYLLARWLFTGGLVAVGAVMQVFAGRFEKVEKDAAR